MKNTKNECVMKKDWCTMHEVLGRKIARTRKNWTKKKNELYGYAYKKETHYKCMSGEFEHKRMSTILLLCLRHVLVL